MFKTPYETTALKFYNVKKIADELRRALIDDTLMVTLPEVGGLSGDILMGVDSRCDNVPDFKHPFFFEMTSGKESMAPVIDIRSTTRRGRGSDFRISDIQGYTFQLIRGRLSTQWWQGSEYDEHLELNSLGEFPMVVFVQWVTQALATRMNLNLEEQRITRIVLGFYWYNLFDRDVETGTAFDDREVRRIAVKLNNVPTMRGQDIVDVSSQMGQMNNLEDLCTNLKTLTQSPRLENLNVGLLITLLGTSWLGGSTSEVMACGLEHPPTFMAVVLMCLRDSSYKKSRIGDLVYRLNTRGIGDQFHKNTLRYLNWG